MSKYEFVITDPEYWRVEKGFSKNDGKELDFEKLRDDLAEKVRLKILLVSGDRLVNFGSPDNNSNISVLVSTKCFQLKQNVAEVVGNTNPAKRLRGSIVSGVKVRSTTGVSPYRMRT